MLDKNIEKLSEFDGHELVSFFYDEKTGLRGFIAIHNTNLGPSAGGTRYIKYKSETDALRDVLSVSRTMTYKCALAGLPYGGGKGAIIKDDKKPKNKDFLYAYAQKINLLNGSFFTGEDVGISEKDVKILAQKSKFILGKPDSIGDPSPWATALGVFFAIKAALKEVFGSEEIKGRTFAIKGLGKVGFDLCRLLYESGGDITATDINTAVIKDAQKKFPKIKIVNYKEIHKQKADVYSPCALGKEFNFNTIRQLKCQIVCGSANYQLVSLRDGEILYKKNILYIPDYLANAGGVINAVSELDKDGYSRDKVLEKLKNIQNTAARVIELSKKKKKPMNYISDELVESIIYHKNGRN